VGNAARADAAARGANGANDLTNTATATDKPSAMRGMPIRDMGRARTVFFVMRGMASGYAGVDNELFFRPNTMMLFGDAKKVTQEIVQALQR
jgi:NAD(P) transhydrogenase subunit beta